MCGALSDRFTAAAATAVAVPSSHFIISGSGGRIGAVANHGCARTRKMVRQKRGERGGRGEGGKERGLREDVETKKGKNIVDVVGGGRRVASVAGTAIIPTTLLSLPLSLSQLRLPRLYPTPTQCRIY